MVILTAKLVAAVKGCKELLVTKEKTHSLPEFPKRAPLPRCLDVALQPPPPCKGSCRVKAAFPEKRSMCSGQRENILFDIAGTTLPLRRKLNWEK